MAIKLTAKLKAYSKAPFYPDFVRDVYSQEDSQVELKYVRSYSKKLNDLGKEVAVGEWTPIDPLLKNIDTKIDQLNISLTQTQTALNHLEDQVHGSGENLTPLDFGDLEDIKSSPQGLRSLSKSDILNSYAHQTLNIIPDQTKVYDKQDKKTWVYVEKINQWVDNGGKVFIPATNNGVFGVITGSTDKFKASIDESEGTLSINGLSEELTLLKSKIDDGINSVEDKLKKSLKKYESSNGYLKSNNFNIDIPTQDSLTKLAMDYLNISLIEDIPNGSKIKNTYNNHTWVFNRYLDSTTNVVSYKWEDFGSDSICIANNDGVHGLVTGSQENFRGFIDINGVISINGLEEEFNSITQTLSELISQIKSIQNVYDAKLSNIEDKLKRLEENA